MLVAEPATRFAFTFGAMRVDVDFEDTERGVLMRLVQSDIPTDDSGRSESHLNCRSCWVYYLLNLKSVIEHGADLRDGGFPDNPVGIHFAQRLKRTSVRPATPTPPSNAGRTEVGRPWYNLPCGD